MKEVWIIEEGECSDYRVSGIFSTEKAERNALNSKNNNCVISERKLKLLTT